jgi:ferredoxin
MRLNYYEFPETVDAQTRWHNGADRIGGGRCEVDRRDCAGCDVCESGWHDCPLFTVEDAEQSVEGIKVSAAKALLKEFGGVAYTYHIDRDGGVFETTQITLTGNNSRHKYNRHL